MVKRDAEKELVALCKQYKAVALVGPRQSGKTTLARSAFAHLPYVSLENPDTRNFALNDPRAFLKQNSSGAILDEAQRAPELFSYLQQVLDDSPETGRFIITGSNNFLLQDNISQSLAGRVAYLYLLPFTLGEADSTNDIDSLIHKGLYPAIYDRSIEPSKWYANYIRTYVERDVRLIKNITNLIAFEKFLRLCAGRVGQLLNMNSLAIESGVDGKTIASWIGVLESSFIVFRLQPHHVSFNKRIVKMPKLYFYDTGLACSLLGIGSPHQVSTHYAKGSLFENLVIAELVKHRYNKGENHNLFFWRDNIGHEVDILADTPNGILPIEIKAGSTINENFFKGIEFWKKLTGSNRGIVVFAGDTKQERSSGISIVPWLNLRSIYDLL
ncbi:ATP-binding protein [Perlabentimonas gracilis]|uniref:ATP-binding protein n=1 Tax=Perlabentimonas gracilis TaxID=2715279 RepID=UPI00140BD4DA|nr:ATP-binding protein [Perlabentimonas gracilis]NHB68946.1 ATP-binding protein [Perlabentimonas gracilis]